MSVISIPFKKMNGLGNDFVVIDARDRDFEMPPALSKAIADRRAGIGCDQVIVLRPSSEADVFMQIVNADGSEVDACGNATRCVATLVGSAHPAIQTGAGILNAVLHGDGRVTVDMGTPRFGWEQIPLAAPQPDTRSINLTFALPDGRVLQDPSVVNVGNPHCIFWVTGVGSFDLGMFGPELEHHPLLPERANISLAEVFPAEMTTSGEGRDRIELRVWERGAGLTQACGTGACAAAVAAHRAGRTSRAVDVHLPGGVLFIEWRASDDRILMTGPAMHDFDGVIELTADGSFKAFSKVDVS